MATRLNDVHPGREPTDVARVPRPRHLAGLQRAVRAAAPQVEAAHPRFRDLLALRRHHDPGECFTRALYRHYRDAFAGATLAA